MTAPTGARIRRRRPRSRPIPALLLVLPLFLAAACASDPVPPAGSPLPTLPESALAGYSVRTEAVDAGSIAAELAGPGSVTPALDGMRSGIERRFSSRRSLEQQVIARTIRFSTAAQAAHYVTWLDQHAADVLGAGPHEESVALAGAIAYSHDPNGCCPGKEMVWWLVAWARGVDAFQMMVGGSQVRPDVVGSLATSLEREAHAT
jgi:hypothetical protein